MPLAEAVTRTIDRLYLAPVAAFVPRQTFRYAACGAFTYGLFDPLCYSFCYNCVVARRFVPVGFVTLSPHIAALALVFPLTFFVGFWLNRHVAFRFSPLRTRTQLFRYALSVGGSILLTYVGLKSLVELCGLWPTPAKVLTTVLTTLYSYFVAKYFTFRHAAE